MTPRDIGALTTRALDEHRLSLPEYYLMISAGYRVTAQPERFVSHACAASKGDPRGHFSTAQLSAALDLLFERGVLLRVTEADLRDDAHRRATSGIPEVFDGATEPGQVDFTDRGYLIYRDVTRRIHGDDFLARNDAGYNLDAESGRFDVYALTSDRCVEIMNEIESHGESSTGAEGTRFVERSGPTPITAWKPNPWVLHTAGYHGILLYVSENT